MEDERADRKRLQDLIYVKMGLVDSYSVNIVNDNKEPVIADHQPQILSNGFKPWNVRRAEMVNEYKRKEAEKKKD